MADQSSRKTRSQTRRVAPALSHTAKQKHAVASNGGHPVQDALAESELRFRMLAECAPVVIWMTDPDQRCTYISKYWREFTGRDPEKDLGYGWVEALHPDDRERAARDLIDAGRSGTECRGEYRVKRANGEYGWLYDYGVPHFRADGTYAGHIGTCSDITAHKAHEKASVDVQNSLVLGQEAERKRVAKELHDDIVQKLALVGLELSEAEQSWLSSSPTVEDKLRSLRQRVKAIALDVHRISHNLHPAVLIHLGLVAALRRLCREFSGQTHIAVDFTGDVAALEPSEEVGIALYRITQECLTNIAKHSGSRQAHVGFHIRSGTLHLTISDTGAGFDPERLTPTIGLGLVSIRERARMIGADVQITSRPQHGTTIALRVPFARVESAAQMIEVEPNSGA